LSSKVCPRCGEHVHRSHTRGIREKFLKAISSYRIHRCHECGWRGWFGRKNVFVHKAMLRTLISLLVTLIITTLIALYLVDRLSGPATPTDIQQPFSP
jgi:DNA-directed RNA polymerase subunit RPC12/RpoP